MSTGRNLTHLAHPLVPAVGRCGEVWGGVGRCGAVWGGVEVKVSSTSVANSLRLIGQHGLHPPFFATLPTIPTHQS